jgi:hypothetical protein
MIMIPTDLFYRAGLPCTPLPPVITWTVNLYYLSALHPTLMKYLMNFYPLCINYRLAKGVFCR